MVKLTRHLILMEGNPNNDNPEIGQTDTTLVGSTKAWEESVIRPAHLHPANNTISKVHPIRAKERPPRLLLPNSKSDGGSRTNLLEKKEQPAEKTERRVAPVVELPPVGLGKGVNPAGTRTIPRTVEPLKQSIQVTGKPVECVRAPPPVWTRTKQTRVQHPVIMIPDLAEQVRPNCLLTGHPTGLENDSVPQAPPENSNHNLVTRRNPTTAKHHKTKAHVVTNEDNTTRTENVLKTKQTALST